jgi:hydroxymethylpyrimidine/phosphomethylpyrimidine kinase
MSAGRTPRALSIAGSDSGGGAGIQADLKAFARCGVHGMTAITAITAQNTTGVEAVLPVPAEMILAQVRAVVEDIGVDAVKVGMLGSQEATLAVARALGELPPGVPVVVDPVMVSESGASLLADDARAALVREILPKASVITPNLPEAKALVGAGDDEQLLRKLLDLGPEAVVLTGGHRSVAVDLLVEADEPGRIIEIEGERHPDGAAHGSGCTHSSVLAAQLALGKELLQAARAARAITGQAVLAGLRDIGAGAGPVDVLDLPSRR